VDTDGQPLPTERNGLHSAVDFIPERDLTSTWDAGDSPCPGVRQWRSVGFVADRRISVIETRSYQSRAAKLLTRNEQDRVVEMLARDPACGAVLKETGGIRKVRFATGERGKSGGVRVVYYFHSEVMPVFLLTLFAKNEKDNLSKSERNSLAALVGELARHFKR
jgi:hypothetical protein